MKRMNDKELEIVIENEKEWRKLLFKKIENMEDEISTMNQTITTLKIKYGVMAIIFGSGGGGIIATVLQYLNKV